MFKKLRQRLASVLTFEEMARCSQQYIDGAMNSEEEKSHDIAIRHKVFKMLLAEEKITDWRRERQSSLTTATAPAGRLKITETHVEKLLAWRHTGFSVYGGDWRQGRQISAAR